ncbi:PH domain-containing protein [Patescibacteria group bacterium]|nr:PH domain-containing protein [Patescibacteria group bacterium]
MKNGIVQLHPDEEIIAIVRRSFLVESPRFLFAILWILLPFFFFFPLLQLGTFGLIFFLALLFGGFYYALKQWLSWHYTLLVITDQRILDVEQRGIIDRQISELSMDEVADAQSRQQGLFQRIFNVGTVQVETVKAQTFDLELSGVRRPKEVCDLILDVQYMRRKI